MSDARRPSPSLRHSNEHPPLARYLDDDLSEGRIKGMWERIDHAPRESRGARLWLALALSASLLLLFGWLSLTRGGEAGQLALVSGDSSSVLSSQREPRTAHFTDGSQIELSGETRLEVLRNDARSFVTALRRGSVWFDVKPGGSRHWVVEAGELSVEVVGTRFLVERDSSGARVRVAHGIVIVRGERVPEGSMRLTAGKSFALPAPGHVRAAPSGEALPPGALEIAPQPAVPSAGTRSSEALPTAAGSAAAARPVPESTDEVERFLRVADAARRQGDNAAAVRAFDAAWQRSAPGDARRGLTALSLARLLIGHDPARAARILRSSLSDMPQALAEDASARLVEAEGRAGHREAARQAAADYLQRFPGGRRADEVRRWSEL